MLSLKRICAVSCIQCCFVSNESLRAESSKEEKNQNLNDLTNQNDLHSFSEKKASSSIVRDLTVLKLIIIDSEQLEIGKEFAIDSLGLKQAGTRIKDGCVYGGSDPQKNDILLSPIEKGVGLKHFMIQYDKRFKKRFGLRDLGEGMGTFVRIDQPLPLKSNNIISFGDSHMITLIDFSEGGQITLKFIDGPKLDQRFTFTVNDAPINIGRMADCSIRFDDSSMSRYHCFIGYENKWFIQDGDGYKPSTNGTWLFVEEFFEVIDGMVFKAAETLFKVIANKVVIENFQ